MIATLFASVGARSAEAVGLIRDAEIEATIRAYAEPLWRAAGLNAPFVQVHLIDDDRINAFVAGGQQLFLNTGLLMRSKSANQVIGVIAHETGHMAGGHLARMQDELRHRTIESIIAMAAGVGAGVASGNPGVGLGTVLLGQNVTLRGFLQYSRTQEASADQAALKFLDATHQSARGLLEFFKILEGEMALFGGNQDPYLSTHPLVPERIEAVQAHVDTSPYSDAKEPPAFDVMHDRMVAKLIGYLRPLDRVLHDYPVTDTSIPARYARAIALFRVSRFQESLAVMDSMLKEEPDDPFFLEQKGQILFQSGRVKDSLPFYQKALALKPAEPLLRQETAQVMIETEDPAYLKDAIGDLSEATRMEPNEPLSWHLMAIAQGRAGNLPEASLSQAEEQLALGNKKQAKFFANKAMDGLPIGSPSWQRAQDILGVSESDDD
ncbi:MAG TPA: M48 family metalloprotease [Dongiaceae bacterium]|nr:M48 family metalloprotease [Dongiaceae bacterium]